MTKIKICGIRSMEEALKIVEAGADAIGFVFTPDSKRYIDPQNAGRISQYLSPFTGRIGVFVNASPAEVLETARMALLTGIQLHGDEDPKEFLNSSVPIIKAIKFTSKALESSGLKAETAFISKKLKSWKGVVQAVLVDSVHDGKFGGTGYPISWNNTEFQVFCELVKEAGIPLILAGGLNPDNVRSGIQSVKPYAVDVSSGVEREGKKDLELVTQFISLVRTL